MTASTGVRAARSAEQTDAELRRTAGILLCAAVLAGLDATIVNVGIDAVANDLGAPLSTVQWVMTGYLLAVSVVMPMTGWASERFGAKRMWLLSVALFVGGSALCGLAQSAAALIAFRVVQGIGGGMMQPIGQAMVAQAAGPSRMGRIMAVSSVPVMFAPVLGPVLGGVIVQGLDWRWMFLVNLPIGAVVLMIAVRSLPSIGARSPQNRLDLRGLVLISPGLAAVVYGFTAAGEARGFAEPGAFAPLLLGAALLATYAVHALRGDATPLIDLRLFARRGFAAATSNSFLLGASLYSSMLLIPLYYQQVQQVSALDAGLLLAPQALGTAITTYLAGRLADRIGPRPLLVTGIVVSLAGTFAFTQLATQPPVWLLVASLVVRGIGMGLTMAPGMAAVYRSVARHEAPRAASALNVLNRIGGSLGTAVLVVVLQNGDPDPAVAFGTTFWWASGITALSLVPAFLFPSRQKETA
ncbi:DHA2 family efflux MFS transporter permease subunit [Saccharopolyspora sp. WRP15-2]|uniref:DHA2 family efflux MFS transporter permease subunit n=1 Tax=Saccharopolyspora oryzae TaxID=2997343 RepID=A0ABT4V4S0_9PSEU|nr:DHA2 family efflux MFS transporter permease subunit [Saccharopolyspora oryzae]MDA3628934.1 DHA2 family efflux MFS transporter permease subunit [Saccharopolyspora oryzae]